MANQWDAQIVVDTAHALVMVNNQFPELQAQTIKPFGQGWDNTVFLINDEFVFRFPRREISAALLMHEVTALPYVAPRVSLQVPMPQWVGKPSSDYPWHFAGYRLLPGMTADRANLSDEQRAQLAQPIASFLVNLHSISIKETALPTQPVFHRLSLDYLVPTITTSLEKMETLNLLKNKNELYCIVAQAHTLRLPESNTLVHGDLYGRHMLLNDNAQLTGIIDWGDVQIGDIALDLTIAHTFLPPTAHDSFKKTYGLIDDQTWLLARLRALHHSLLMVLYGHDTGDHILLGQTLRSLDYIAQQVKI